MTFLASGDMLFCKYCHPVGLKFVDTCKAQNGKGIWGEKMENGKNGFHRALLLLIYVCRVLCKAFLHYPVFWELVCKCRCLHFLDYSPFTLECKPSYTHHRQASVASGKGHSQHSSLCRLILQESPVFMDSSYDQLWWKHDSGEREDHGHAYFYSFSSTVMWYAEVKDAGAALWFAECLCSSNFPSIAHSVS